VFVEHLPSGIAVYRSASREASLRVVLVHGTMDRGAGMLRVAREVKHPNVTRYDRRGYGRSFHCAPARSFDDHLDDLAEVVGNEPTVVFGHSYGGVLALALATRGHAALKGVAVYEAPMAWQPWGPAPPRREVGLVAAVTQFVAGVLGQEVWDRLPQSSRDARIAEGQTMLDELAWQRTQHFDLGAIAVPVLAGVGAESGLTAQRAAAVARNELGPDVVRVIDGATHPATLTHPADIANMIDELVLLVGDEFL